MIFALARERGRGRAYWKAVSVMRDEKSEGVRWPNRLHPSMTEADRRLWTRLRGRQMGGAKFVRQAPMGRLVVDFVCREKQLIVEVDSSEHFDPAANRVRDESLRSRNFRILRFKKDDVLTKTDGVCEAIRAALLETSPDLEPSPAGRKRGKKAR